MTRVDIIVVTWNGREDTLRCLESLAPQIAAHAFEASVTVVDNGSDDGTAREVLARFPSTRVIRLHENRGFTGGVAAGVDVSVADFAVLLNNDATAEPGWLESLVSSLQEAPSDVIAVAGRIVDTAGERIDFSGGLVTFDGHAFQMNFRRNIGEAGEPSDGAEMLFACGGNMIVRRGEYLELGGFDRDYFAYLEDVDFGWRAWLSGHRILYDRDAVVRHRSSATSDRLGAFERGVLFERNAIATAVKNYEERLFRDVSGPLFLTLLHRLHHYTVTRNRGAEPLTRPALGDEAQDRRQPPARGRMDRLRWALASAITGKRFALLDDPLTAMQFRAVTWFFENEARLMEKREAIQARRRRSDSEIFDRFPLHSVPTYPGDEELMGSRLFQTLTGPLRFRKMSIDEIMQR